MKFSELIKFELKLIKILSQQCRTSVLHGDTFTFLMTLLYLQKNPKCNTKLEYFSIKHDLSMTLSMSYQNSGMIQNHLDGTKPQSSNWVFKLNLHKILKYFEIEILLKIHFLLGFFYLELFICLSDVKWPKSFRSFILWTPTKALLWICCRAYSSLRPLPAFYNILKLNLSSKTDIILFLNRS